MERWYASDHHIRHTRIIEYTGRPFANATEMDEALVTWHNELVKTNDHISFLGDVTIVRGGRIQQEWFIKEMKKYNGHKRLFLGNHDHFPIKTYIEAGFEKIYATWRSQENIIFSHIPIHTASMGSARANVHGHTHEKPDYTPALYQDLKTQKIYTKPYINVCVERTEYKPITIDEIQVRIALAIKAAEGANEKVQSSTE